MPPTEAPSRNQPGGDGGGGDTGGGDTGPGECSAGSRVHSDPIVILVQAPTGIVEEQLGRPVDSGFVLLTGTLRWLIDALAQSLGGIDSRN